MKNRICPHLGVQEDPQTAFVYPAEGNTCFKAHPAGRVSLEHQKLYCLRSGHTECPVFARQSAGPLPAAIAAPAAATLPFNWRVVWMALGVVLFLVGFAFMGGWDRTMAMLGFGPAAVPVTGYQDASPTPFRPAQTYTPTAQPIGGLLLEFTRSPDPTRAACPQPGGWTVYVVKPTDSLLRLSMVYDLPVEALQQANCMGSQTAIRPGDQLYVPVLPTVTPSPTLTPTQVIIVQNPLPVQPTDEPEPDPPDPTDPPPTGTTAPTDLPPTSQPTVEPRPTDRPTDEPRPTREPKPTDEPKPTKEPRPTQEPKPDDPDPPDDEGPPNDPGPPDNAGPPDRPGPPNRP